MSRLSEMLDRMRQQRLSPENAKMTEAAASEAVKDNARRTQAERSNAMRQRLIEATVQCLAAEGYVGTTVSQIITAAGVSRGAPLHHFPTKASLIEATADHLIRQLYIYLGHAIRALEHSDNRLNDMILASWHELFGKTESLALMELMLASRRDDELSAIIQKLWAVGYKTLEVATQHYFEPARDGINATHLFVLTHWLLTGMAMERHLMKSDAFAAHFLTLWSRVLGEYLQAKPGVTTPPPRPVYWDSSLSDPH
ncbi:TetR/AcrR family transcriptional regulator [Perlucidibaca aquatica]|uniref:TetR/AcrR family transcriptional regulator n=1 Tax=Perlucidibaca aquatica TaxID=1852776 RepID=UPI000A7BBFFE|nr:TetR/AcrR family transcriptional regulator [Perlucidibaca aquatica]